MQRFFFMVCPIVNLIVKYYFQKKEIGKKRQIHNKANWKKITKTKRVSCIKADIFIMGNA